MIIRQLKPQETDAVIDLWLRASIQAHDFIDSEYWIKHQTTMRNVYLPASETCVSITEEGIITGFYSLTENTLAALFVALEYQRTGIGGKLLRHAKQTVGHLRLTVYRENGKAYAFYKQHGFITLREQLDEQTGHMEIVMSSTETSEEKCTKSK